MNLRKDDSSEELHPKIQSLSKRELELFKIAFIWYKRYDNCNPDVGMGPSDSGLIDDLVSMCSFDINMEDKVRLLKMVRALGDI